ncbi:hypothetical protein BD410DRAFT_779432 [Rickenella mellea]|uniref:Uncharacterized protein n=1 Tax=Rickenella mellea TaxID=50990 RepID=A0A4R5XDQ7_9AGAM|nr:hypothetical protein BD410DRAFT_779432 [Rickenella mellea]
MGQLEALDGSLDILRENIAQRREHVQLLNNHWALQDGIRNIPHEILALIFQFAHSSGGNRAFRVTETLSLVCTRFRDICLQTPQMWSSLRNHFSLDKTRLNLNRSKDTTLDISIHHYYHDRPLGPKTTQFLETVIPHSPRWLSLDIYTEDSCLARIISKLPILQLPKLAMIRHVEETDEAKLANISILNGTCHLSHSLKVKT